MPAGGRLNPRAQCTGGERGAAPIHLLQEEVPAVSDLIGQGGETGWAARQRRLSEVSTGGLRARVQPARRLAVLADT